MKILVQRILPIAVIAAACLLATNVRANFLLDPPSVVTGQPANPSDELDRLNDAIDAYNAFHGTSYPEAVNHLGQVQTPSGPTSITIDFAANPVNYLMLKWDGRNVFYYVGDEVGSVTFDNTLVLNRNGKPEGLSHYALFDRQDGHTVPDGGATVVLLGLALTGLGLIRRRI